MHEMLVENEEFKDSPLGKIPKDWNFIIINDCLINGFITDIQDGNHGEAHPKSDDFVSEGIPFVMAKDLVNGQINIHGCNKIHWKQYKSLRVGFARPGDVLVSHKGTIGLTAIVPNWLQDVMLTPQVTYYRVNEGQQLSNKFLFWFFQSDFFQRKLQILSAQSTRSYIGITQQKTLSILIPPFEEQQGITKILDMLDNVIARTSDLIAKLKQTKAGLLHDLLTRGLDENGQLRNPETHPEQFKDSVLGKIPKEWEVRTAEEVCLAVIDCKNRTPPITSDGYPVIRTTNIRDGKFVYDNLLFTNDWGYCEWTKKGVPSPGDVLITREAPVGEVCLLPEKMINACLGQRMMMYKVNPIIMNNIFMLLSLLSPIVKSKLLDLAGGSTVGHVRVNDIRTLRVHVPPIHEQEKIVQYFICTSQRITLEEAYLNKLKLQKQGLMQDLLTGKVRVKSMK